MNVLQEKYLGVTFELPEQNFIPGATQ
jgi:hypothetical protein